MRHCPDAPLNEPDDYLSEEELDEMYDAELESYEMFNDLIL
jgi:hypothetical protein